MASRVSEPIQTFHKAGCSFRGGTLNRADVEWLLSLNERLQASHQGEQDLNLRGVILTGVSLQDLDLSYARLERANLSNANLKGMSLVRAQGANLRSAHVEGADLRYANVEEAHLCSASFDAETRIEGLVLHGLEGISASFLDSSGQV